MGNCYGAAPLAHRCLGGALLAVVMLPGMALYHMNLSEACTAVGYELPIITVIFQQLWCLGMMRQLTETSSTKSAARWPRGRTSLMAEGFG